MRVAIRQAFAIVASTAAVLLSACGSSNTSPSTTSQTRTPTPTAAPSPSGNPTLAHALAASDIGGDFTLTSEGLLGGTPNTDSRVFTNADGTSRYEVDLVAYASPSAALTDYPQFEASAKNQVTTIAFASTPFSSSFTGQMAREFVGTNGTDHPIASLSFLQGSFIAVITMVSTGSLTTGDVGPLTEEVAATQASKLPAG